MSIEKNLKIKCQLSEKDFQCTGYNISWLKLAVAVAIIRNKPSHLTSKQYAERLQTVYMQSQFKLQEQHATAMKEIEELKAVVENLRLQQMTQPMGDASNQSSLQISSNFHPSLTTRRRDASYVENLCFIQSTLTLQNLAQSYNACEAYSLVKAATQSIKTMNDVIQRDVLAVSESCLCQAAAHINSLLEILQWLEERPCFMQEVCLLVERIVGQLFQPADYGWRVAYRRKQLVVKMVVQFMKGKSLPLLLTILESLIDSLETFCQQLHASQVSSHPVDPDQYDSGYFLISSLELILKQWLEECPMDTVTLQETLRRLDVTVKLLKDSFPLVAQALFRVCSLCEILIQNK